MSDSIEELQRKNKYYARIKAEVMAEREVKNQLESIKHLKSTKNTYLQLITNAYNWIKNYVSR